MLKAEGLTKRYGPMEAVREVSLTVSPGEILTILGPSGSGKTTVLRLLAGFERPDEGIVSLDGREVSSPRKMLAPSRRGLSMIFQDLALWPHMTVKENIRFVLSRNGMNRSVVAEEIERMLAKVNLSGVTGRYPHQLSGGEKQRLAIARALASKPAYLLMDEPFSNLDSLLKDELQDVVMGLREGSHMGIIYVTHHIEEALALTGRLLIMKRGRMVQTGRKEEVLSHPSNDFVKRFLRI